MGRGGLCAQFILQLCVCFHMPRSEPNLTRPLLFANKMAGIAGDHVWLFTDTSSIDFNLNDQTIYVKKKTKCPSPNCRSSSHCSLFVLFLAHAMWEGLSGYAKWRTPITSSPNICCGRPCVSRKYRVECPASTIRHASALLSPNTQKVRMNKQVSWKRYHWHNQPIQQSGRSRLNTPDYSLHKDRNPWTETAFSGRGIRALQWTLFVLNVFALFWATFKAQHTRTPTNYVPQITFFQSTMV